jgi:hypothetical protein
MKSPKGQKRRQDENHKWRDRNVSKPAQGICQLNSKTEKMKEQKSLKQ